MDESQQTAAFAADLNRVVERYRAEFNLTVAAAIGTLEVVKLELFHQQKDNETESD